MSEARRTVTVGGVIATTDFLPQRGIRLSREALQGVVDRFQPGQPTFSNHGARQVGRAAKLELRPRDDGEWELYGESDIDIPPGESAESVLAGLPQGGWSLAIAEIGDDAPPDPAVTVAIDYMSFDASDRDEARIPFEGLPVSTYVTWYHQFAELPQPAVVLDLARHVWLSLPPEVWDRLFKAAEEAVVKLIFKPKAKRTVPLVFRLRSGQFNVSVEVPADADPGLVREVFRGARSVLRASHETKGSNSPDA